MVTAKMGCKIKVIHVMVTVVLLYLFISVKISRYVYITSQKVIDEEFHLPLGLKYCQFVFEDWDPKVTTLPGLYLWSIVICSYLSLCTVWCLRFSTIVASTINMLLLYNIRRCWHKYDSKKQAFVNMLCMATFPVLFFFSQFYYTDVPSMMVVNWFLLNSLKGHHTSACLTGYLAFFFRQNNIIYVAFMGAFVFLGNFHKLIMEPLCSTGQIVTIDPGFFFERTKTFFKSGLTQHSYWNMLYETLAYAIPLLAPLTFFYFNNGIVVGDKDAHGFTLHLPQFFYFSLFSALFAWPHFLRCFRPFVRYVIEHPKASLMGLLAIEVIIWCNSYAHPYLLADNRHYMFYFWNRFLNTAWKRALWAPIYFYCMYCIQHIINSHREKRFILCYPFLVFLLICFQGLVDLRYYIGPYIVFRAFLPSSPYKVLFLEFTFNCLIIILAFKTFFSKEIIWADMDGVQRLIF